MKAHRFIFFACLTSLLFACSKSENEIAWVQVDIAEVTKPIIVIERAKDGWRVDQSPANEIDGLIESIKARKIRSVIVMRSKNSNAEDEEIDRVSRQIAMACKARVFRREARGSIDSILEVYELK